MQRAKKEGAPFHKETLHASPPTPMSKPSATNAKGKTRAGRGTMKTPASAMEAEVTGEVTDVKTLRDMGANVITAEQGIAMALTEICFKGIREERSPYLEVTKTGPRDRSAIKEAADLPTGPMVDIEEYGKAALRVKEVNARKKKAIDPLNKVIDAKKAAVIRGVRLEMGKDAKARSIKVSGKPHAIVITTGVKTQELNKTIVQEHMERVVRAFMTKRAPGRIGEPFEENDVEAFREKDLEWVRKAVKVSIAKARADGDFQVPYEKVELEEVGE